VRVQEDSGVGWARKPKSILTVDKGTLELADGGDPAVAEEALNRLAERFGAVVRDRLLRNLMGDPDRESEYWYLIVRGREYMVMRCTAPEAPRGVYVIGPIGTPQDLALFRAVAASFGAVERDRRSRWWRFWG
jgi:hypothetical protein